MAGPETAERKLFDRVSELAGETEVVKYAIIDCRPRAGRKLGGESGFAEWTDARRLSRTNYPGGRGGLSEIRKKLKLISP